MLYEGAEMRLADGGALALRPVAPADEEFLYGLYLSTRERELSQVEWAEGQKEQFARWQFELQRREYDARFPDAEYDVIEVEGRTVGRVWVGRAAEEIRLLDIALLPAALGGGLGGAVVGALVAAARAWGTPLRHMVFMLNTDARRFYERLGFRVFEDLGGYLHMEWAPESNR